jgi:hypothetical protein
MLGVLFAVLSIVVLLGWIVRRREIRETVEGERPMVTDEVLRRILSEGELEVPEEEPLDEEEIRDAEDEFWDQTGWDDPEEFRP